MDFVSVRVITHDVERLATFWEQVTGLPATRLSTLPADRPAPLPASGRRQPIWAGTSASRPARSS